MIEIYARDEHGIEHLVATYKTYEEFFAYRRPNEDDLKSFGYKVGDRTKRHGLFAKKVPVYDLWYWNDSSRFCYLMYDYDKFITPDNLIGKYRDWLSTRKYKYRQYSWRCKPYQHGRPLRIHNEKRQYYANDDEDAPKIRAKRSPRYLPDDWDRSFYPAERCWKTQSKRKHQW